jgi:hypothetical protein
MSLSVPRLDDKTFNEIVDEARSLIPRYYPEWTDHNVHDPGITFIELFAWLAEMQIYQLDQITDRNYIKFLKLLNYYPCDIQPASVDITFENKENITAEIPVPAGTRIFTGVEPEQLVFEVQEDFNLIPAQIKSIITTYDSKIVDNTEANETNNIYFAAFGEKPEKEGILGIGLEFFDKLPEKEIHITFILFEDDLPPEGTHGNEPSHVIPSADIVWEYQSDGTWKDLPVLKDSTLALTRNGRIVFVLPSDMEMNEKDGLYWLRCRIQDGWYEIVPYVSRILINTLSAIQVETFNNEDLGTSSGFPDQKVRLKKKPVMGTSHDALPFDAGDVLDWPGLLKMMKNQAELPEPGKWISGMFDENTQNLISEWDESEIGTSLKYAVLLALNAVMENRDLYVVEVFKEVKFPYELKKLTDHLAIISDTEMKILNCYLIESAFPDTITKRNLVVQVQDDEGEWETWIEVNDFESSDPDDLHYIFDPEEGEIIFGNGLNGRIPSEGHKIRAMLYKTTKGLKGNITKEQMFRFAESGTITGENIKEATGGRFAESIDHAKGRAKKDFRTNYRAITSKDYEQLARSTPGLRVLRAKAVTNYHPDYPCIAVPGNVTVVTVPYTREGNFPPVPGNGFMRTVLAHLENHRLITTDIHVIKPEYVKISVQCKVHVMKKFSSGEVKKRINTKLEHFLHPLTGGSDGQGWPFGRSVFPSEIYEIIDNVEGVDYATDVFLRAGEQEYQKEAIRIPRYGLVFFGEQHIKFI